MPDIQPLGIRLNRKGKPSIIRWGGLLYGLPSRSRVIALVVLMFAIVSMTFTQFGFIGIGALGDYDGYVIVLLAPIALGALLLGVWQGTLLGFVAGCVLLYHSKVQPLDYYEVAYITPASSILLFTVTAFILGLLLAVALRKNPPLWRKILYIFVVCAVTSVLFTMLFTLNVMAQTFVQLMTLTSDAGTELSEEDLNAYVFSMASRIASVGTQAHLDAIVMAVTCIAGLLVWRKMAAHRGQFSLRTTFRLWLLLVVSMVFMLTTGFSFVVITEQAKDAASGNMDSEISYLITQLKAYQSRVDALDKVLTDEGIDEITSEEQSNRLHDVVSMDKMLDGYTKEDDGTIVVFRDNTVVLSDDPTYKVGTNVDYYIDVDDMLSGMLNENASTNDMAQILYDENMTTKEDAENIEDNFEDGVTQKVGYMKYKKYDEYTIMMITPATNVFAGRNGTMAWTTLSALILLGVVFGLVSRLLGRVVARPIDETNKVLARITDGDLNARVNVAGSREFASLSAGVNTTVDALKNWISEAETRMDAELATAKAIQESALPLIFPPFPDYSQFDIYASMRAAREVGGDFYDFFLIEDGTGEDAEKLGFVIADVSGKGVPAALFMMAAKTEIENFVQSGMELGEAIENANRKLCEGNNAGMFVTAFVGVLEIDTGHVTYVNAGHNPPLLWRAGGWEWMTEKSGLPLGLFDGLPYTAYEVDCSIGDQFLLYTDGVTEAMNVNDELYGEERLMALVQENFTLHPRSLLRAVNADVSAFTRGAQQSDDITMLALEVGVPPEITATLTLPAETGNLPVVNDFVHSELDRRLCPVRAQKQLDIAVEELFVNVCHYAYPDAGPDHPGTVRVSYTYSAEPPSILVEIADDGVPYNPLAKPDAVTPDDIAEVPIGGLGILMAKNSVDDMTYEYVDRSNVVSITKRW